MSNNAEMLKASVIKYCSSIGEDPLLVQGAGGNVSWKDGDILWIKASGMWLVEADEKDIFVPVDLHHLNTAIGRGDFYVTPNLHGKSVLRPSIETLLHALMPHRVVMHLHAIEVLAHLVRDNCHNNFLSLLDPSINWVLVDYHKPGADLAAAVSVALNKKSNVDVIFLYNHGVVIGGADATKVSHILNTLTSSLRTTPISNRSNSLTLMREQLSQHDQYAPVQDADVHQLALNTDLFNRLNSEWALYPDHLVFLGARPYTYNTWCDFYEETEKMQGQPELIFIKGHGVFVKSTFNTAKHAQLRCYYDVLVRQVSYSTIKVLTNRQITELLNWDAELYRQLIAK